MHSICMFTFNSSKASKVEVTVEVLVKCATKHSLRFRAFATNILSLRLFLVGGERKSSPLNVNLLCESGFFCGAKATIPCIGDVAGNGN